MRRQILATLSVCVLGASLTPLSQTSSRSQETSANPWVGRYREVEEYLRTAECDAMENIGPATSALKRCVLRPGGPVSRMAWKPDLPGGYRGFRESYKTNIAAYELDRLLKLDMVPPTVERELQGHKGSATFWVENVVPADDKTLQTASERSRWEKRLTQMMMFDALIGNRDRNRLNILRDTAGNMILLDHSRAFGSGNETVKLTRYDPNFWARIDKLTRTQLDAALGPWLDANDITAILDRRERMKADINRRAREPGFVHE